MDASARSRAGWTPERRARHAEKIRAWKPWEKSTGPRTAAGKAVSSRNAVLSENRAKLAVIVADVEKNFRLYDRIQRELKRDAHRIERAAAKVRERVSAKKRRRSRPAAPPTPTNPSDAYLQMLHEGPVSAKHRGAAVSSGAR